MNHDPDKLHDLLEDVLPQHSATCGPDHAALLHMVREERTHRRGRRAVTTAAAGAAIVLCISLAQGWLPGTAESGMELPAAAAPSAEATSAPPQPLVIQQVNDEQLLALLQDTPAAIMVWPNGRRTLLMVDP